jgi:hypothetical protein
VLHKEINGKKRVTVIKKINKVIPPGTLLDILSDKQTGLGKKWLEEKMRKKK